MDFEQEQQNTKVKFSTIFFGLSIGFFLTAFFLIPLSSFQDLIFQKIQEVTGLKINAEKLSIGISFPPSLKFTQLSISVPPSSIYRFKELYLSPSIMSLIPGNDKKISIWGSAYGGDFNADLSQGVVETSVSLNADKILYRDLDFLPYHKEINFLTNAKIEVKFPNNKIKELTGNIMLELKGITIQEFNLSGFDIPARNISKAVIEAKADGKEKGKLIINKKSFLGQSNDPIEIKMFGGHVDILRERIELPIELRFDESTMQSFSALNLFLGSFKRQDKENTFQLMLSGSFYGIQPLPYTN